jgi:hypothetical protein
MDECGIVKPPRMKKPGKTLNQQHFPGSKIAAEGLEPGNLFTGFDEAIEDSGPTSGPIGPDLKIVIQAWPHLSDAARREILATIRSESLKGGKQ